MKLVDYGGFKNWVPLNALLYSPNQGFQNGNGNRDFAIVTLHGGQGNAMGGINLWLAPYLATKGYTVIAPNKRNSGRYSYTSNFDWCEEDIKSVIDYLETKIHSKKVVLIGHSGGAAETIYYQGKTQDKRVIALVLMGTPLFPEDTWEGRDDEKGALELSLLHMNDEKPFFLDGCYSDGMYVTAEHFVSHWAPDSNNNTRKWIGKVSVPIFFIDGEKPLNILCNPQASLQLQKLASSSPRTECQIMEGISHGFGEHLDETADVIGNWLDKLCS